MAINLGHVAQDYGNAGLSSGYTSFDTINTAGSAGTLVYMEVWMNTTGSVKVGTAFFGGSWWQINDYENLGSCAAGVLNTFSGLSCSVSSGDCLAGYSSDGAIEMDSSASGDSDTYFGDHFVSPDYGETYIGETFRLGFSAADTAPVTGKNWNGVVISKWNGVLVSKINGI